MMRKCRVWSNWGQFKRSFTVHAFVLFIAFLPAGLLLWGSSFSSRRREEYLMISCWRIKMWW